MKDSGTLSIRDVIDYGADYDTLFIDRDGTVNRRVPGGRSILTAEEIEFTPGFLANIGRLAEKFRHIILLNTHHHAKGPTPSPKQQEEINEHIRRTAEEHGGRIDAFYTEWVAAADPRPEHDSSMFMPLRARRDIPAISFSRSLMIGDAESDRMLAFNCGMKFMSLSPDAPTQFDTTGIDEEISLLRSEVTTNIEVLNKLLNSNMRIYGIRLASRCCCHALDCGGRIFMLCAPDSGIDDSYLGVAMKRSEFVEGTEVLVGGTETSLSDQISVKAASGDVALLISAKGNTPEMADALDAAVQMGIVTVSITGAKPSNIDLSDVVIKIPSTDINTIQANTRLVLGIIHSFILRHRR